jgi:hypothetical protein
MSQLKAEERGPSEVNKVALTAQQKWDEEERLRKEEEERKRLAEEERLRKEAEAKQREEGNDYYMKYKLSDEIQTYR